MAKESKKKPASEAARVRKQSVSQVAAGWFDALRFKAKRRPEKTGRQRRSASLREGAIAVEAPEHAELDAARMAADAGLGALAGALADPNPSVRARSLAMIAELSGERASRLLRAMIHDPEVDVRCAAIATSKQLGSMSVVSSLIVALEDAQADVRRAAAHAIAKITGQAVLPEDADFHVSPERIAELKRWWMEERVRELS